MTRRVYAVRINPEPWVVPPFSVGRLGKKLVAVAGRDEATHACKEAIRESLRSQGAEMLEAPYHVHFLFYRHLATYETDTGRDHTKHVSDATNMQKLAEDALQGVLIDNDENNRFVSSQVVEQGRDVDPMIVVMISSGGSVLGSPVWFPPGFAAVDVRAATVRARETVPVTSNAWPPPAPVGGF